MLDDAARASAKTVAGLSAIHPEGHPVRGIAIAELGKILVVDEPPSDDKKVKGAGEPAFPPSGAARLRLACETLIRARGELEVGFGGEGGMMGRMIRELGGRVERELGVWDGRGKVGSV